MTDHVVKERISMLLDEELSVEESLGLLERIENDPELATNWRRYCIISETIRDGNGLLPDDSFVSRVSAAIAQEPTVLAPRANRQNGRERVVTAALAASLAVVAVLVGKSLNDYSPVRGPDFLAHTGFVESNVESPLEPDFRDYLVTHYETAYLAGVNGMLPSIRLLSYEPNR